MTVVTPFPKSHSKPPKRHFTRQHYLALQDVIRAFVVAAPIDSQATILDLVKAMCVLFASEYPDFDEKRFLRLCALAD